MLTQACVPPFPLHTHTICSTHSQTIAAQAMMVRYGPGTHAGHAQFSYLHTHTHAHTHTHIHTHTQTVCLTHSHFVAKAMMARQWIWCTHPTCTTLLFANTHMLFVEHTHTHYLYCCTGNDGQTVDLVLTPDMHASISLIAPWLKSKEPFILVRSVLSAASYPCWMCDGMYRTWYANVTRDVCLFVQLAYNMLPRCCCKISLQLHAACARMRA